MSFGSVLAEFCRLNSVKCAFRGAACPRMCKDMSFAIWKFFQRMFQRVGWNVNPDDFKATCLLFGYRFLAVLFSRSFAVWACSTYHAGASSSSSDMPRIHSFRKHAVVWSPRLQQCVLVTRSYSTRYGQVFSQVLARP